MSCQALLDDETKKTRYSILKSAATIALLSLAVGAVAATAGAALLPEALALEGVSVSVPFSQDTDISSDRCSLDRRKLYSKRRYNNQISNDN
jgi:hypothetical protein